MKNKQSERSVKWMTEALLSLMETQPFESIKITDITEKAGIARLTFYRHFETKEQILLAYINDEFECYLQEFSRVPTSNTQQALCWCFEYWKRDARITNLLVRHNLTSLMLEPFGEYLQRFLEMGILPKKTTHFQRKFLQGGLLMTMIEWIQDPKGYSPEEMADLVLDVTNIAQAD